MIQCFQQYFGKSRLKLYWTFTACESKMTLTHEIWIVIVIIIQLTRHIDRNSTEVQVWPQGNNKWGLPRGPPRGFWEGFLVLEGSVVVQFQCLGPQKKAYSVNYRIFRVLKFLNWDPEGSGGLTELKKHRKPVFGPK